MEFAMVSVNVLDNEDLSRLEKLAYVFLCKFMNRESCKCFPSYATLAKNLDCTRRTAIRVVKNLIKVGILDKEYRFDEEGDNRSNSYTLLPELQRKIKYKKTSKTIKQEKIEIEEEKTQEKIEIEEENFAVINKVREVISEPLTDQEIKTLLKAADGNIEKIKEKYEIAKSQSCNNLVGFLIKAIKDNYQPNINKSVKKKCKFQNYTSERKIDPKRLEEIERVKLARKMEEIDRKEKAKEEKVIGEKPEIILRSFTQNELNNLFESYKESFDYGLSLVGRTITNNLSAQGLDLSYKFLPEADLSNSDLTGADLTGINLEQANLTKVRFGQAKLNNANLKEADLREADLTNADLTGADLTGANLRKAKLKGIKLKGTKLKNIETDRDNWEYLRSLRE